MKRLLLIALLVLSRGPAYAEWVAVEKNNQLAGLMTVYVDLSTIHREEHLVTIRQLIDYKIMQGGRSPSRFSSTIIQVQFDCANERRRVLALTDFWDNMGSGEATGAYIDGDDWIPVKPDSIDQALWEIACNKH
jgi:hypothetical protein